MDVTALDGRLYAKFVSAGAFFLRKYRGVLNDLNVYPVPDGDTGTNMFLTVRQAAIAAAKVQQGPLSEVAAAAATGALMGARGNSGVIISQMLRGFAHHVRHRSEIDTFMMATAMREAVTAAKQALVKPVEGTIISVAEAAADAAYRLALHERDFYRLISGVLGAANDALDRTPEQLPALKEAGVVDAGGAGFVYFLEGVLRFLPEQTVRATAYPRRPVRQTIFTPQQIVGENKYCTEFILQQATCSNLELREALKPRGDSLIVAGEPPAIKVHIHTGNPDAVKTIASRHGELTRVKIDNMEQQHNVMVVDRPEKPYSIAFVVPGPGFDRIARELGAEVTVDGSHNPSVRDLLLAINKCLSNTVYLFVNDKNVALAAKEAAALSGRDVHVVATPDAVLGLAGLLEMRQADERAPDAQTITSAAQRTRTANIFLAGKDASVGGTSVRRGTPLAAFNGTLFAGETPARAAAAALEHMGAASGGLITVYYGGSQKERDAQRLVSDLRTAFPQADAEYYYGGQKSIEFWISFDE